MVNIPLLRGARDAPSAPFLYYVTGLAFSGFRKCFLNPILVTAYLLPFLRPLSFNGFQRKMSFLYTPQNPGNNSFVMSGNDAI
jgi:hypothetical protein